MRSLSFHAARPPECRDVLQCIAPELDFIKLLKIFYFLSNSIEISIVACSQYETLWMEASKSKIQNTKSGGTIPLKRQYHEISDLCLISNLKLIPQWRRHCRAVTPRCQCIDELSMFVLSKWQFGTSFGAPDPLTRLGARTFLLIFICCLIQKGVEWIEKCVHRGASARWERHTLSLGRNKHEHNNSAPSHGIEQGGKKQSPSSKAFSFRVLAAGAFWLGTVFIFKWLLQMLVEEILLLKIVWL